MPLATSPPAPRRPPRTHARTLLPRHHGGRVLSPQVFNAVFARIILKEELTRPKICGSATILIGIIIAVCCTIGITIAVRCSIGVRIAVRCSIGVRVRWSGTVACGLPY